jgi:hypothetical protein
LKTILDLCGGTGSWSKPYVDAGYDVHIIDQKMNGQDIRLFKYHGQVHGILAAPPCTMFAVSGNRYRAIEKYYGVYEEKIIDALSLVDACLRIITTHNPEWWALENPIGTLKNWIGPPKLYFNPYEYGDPYTKRTCVWGNFKIPVKSVVEPSEGSKLWKQYGGKSERTKTIRSITPKGFAEAFFKSNP